MLGEHAPEALHSSTGSQGNQANYAVPHGAGAEQHGNRGYHRSLGHIHRAHGRIAPGFLTRVSLPEPDCWTTRSCEQVCVIV